MIALKMQLLECGAGIVETSELLDIPQLGEYDVSFNQDAAHATSLEDSTVQLNTDSAFASAIAVPGSSTEKADEKALDSRLMHHAIPPAHCPICMEMIAPTCCFRAETCGHTACLPCMRVNLSVIVRESSTFPPRCPTCAVEFTAHDCLLVLSGTEMQREMERLILERAHCARVCYCSNKNCAMPFDFFELSREVADPENAGKPLQYKNWCSVTCPLCGVDTCVQCKTAWHEGRSCEAYQAEIRNDDIFKKVCLDKKWTPCPQCGNAIERRLGDCMYIRCRCGCKFCHHCGKEYLNSKEGALNIHGRPNCDCGLFPRS